MAEKKPQFNIIAKKPDDWSDRSMLVFASPDTASDLDANVVVTRETMAKAENFKKYVDRQKAAMDDQIPQFDLLKMKFGKIKDLDACNLHCRWMSPAGRVKQRIVFISVGQGEVVTYAATAGVDIFDDFTEKFNDILSSVDISEI